jgi:hypothetical protein
MSSLKRGSTGAIEADTSKKYRSAINDCATAFICTITQELPFDPVFAADGHVYGKKAITEWLQRKKTSPLTNEPMCNVLRPAVGVCNAIEALVDSGAVTGELAESWQTQREWKDELADLPEKARDRRNSKAMLELYKCHRFGLRNAVEDEDKALLWAERGARHDLRTCAYITAQEILDAEDEEETAHAISLLTRAAMDGSSTLAGKLARIYGKGRVVSVPRCAAQARYFGA